MLASAVTLLSGGCWPAALLLAHAAEEEAPLVVREDSYEIGIQEIAITVLEIVAFLALILITIGV